MRIPNKISKFDAEPMKKNCSNGLQWCDMTH